MMIAESHCGLGRGDHHHEEDEDLSGQHVPVRSESDERQIHSVEHQLNRHEDCDDVALDQKSRYPAGEQNSAQHEIVRKGHHYSFTFCAGPPPGTVGLLASTTAPMMAIRIKMEVTSNGSRNS